MNRSVKFLIEPTLNSLNELELFVLYVKKILQTFV